MSLKRFTQWAGSALVMMAATFAGASAQSAPEQDVAIWNDHMHTHQVFVYDAEGDRHVLGYVGHDELEYFDVPDEIEAMGSYRVAVQQHLPLPQIGVPAIEFPIKITPLLTAAQGRTVGIVVSQDPSLSTLEVY